VSEPVVTIHNVSDSSRKYNYVVIALTYNNLWVWVKQRNRITWELPGGHIEPDETPIEAALRELFEETGTVNCTIVPLCDFTVKHNRSESFNRFYYAKTSELGNLPISEIEEVGLFSDFPPHPLTHGEIQKQLFEIAKEHYSKHNT
jgi:8-oxo-dGTP diphosphatase